MATMISTVIKNLKSRPRTRLYPAEERQLPAASRGHIEFDMRKCIFCTLCAKRCPADAITVDRKGKTLVFDPFRCIVCEFCLEGCAKEAISLLKQWSSPAAVLYKRTFTTPGEEE
ncbi:MAG TPA: 4Fe-4S dicluster domain-containing protein [Syntrophomonadaceae bacterium]|nr:4Fe-4S dicluster domain-containing protein [Syntrophomonadaceae bacterium]